jgi:hypothetical protein
MKLRWFKNLKESDKAVVKTQIKSSKPVLDRLAYLLQEDLEDSLRYMAWRTI